MAGVIQIPASRIDEASRVLARAFHNDPLQSYTFPDSAQRVELSPPHFAAILRYGYLAGEIWGTEGALDGAAIWCCPGHQFNDAMLEEAGYSGLSDTIGADSFQRFTRVIDHLDTFHHRDMPGPHWYAMVIGVDPALQGRGVGGSLLQPVLARADAAKEPCYLETCQPRNITFYRKHGFEVLAEGVEPNSGLSFWTFLREPR